MGTVVLGFGDGECYSVVPVQVFLDELEAFFRSLEKMPLAGGEVDYH